MAKKIQRDDTVRVIYGKDRDKTGKVLQVIPKSGKVIVAGVNQVTKHVGNRQGVTQTGIIKREAPIPISSVAYMDPNNNEYGRVGWRTLEDGTKDRIIKNARTS